MAAKYSQATMWDSEVHSIDDAVGRKISFPGKKLVLSHDFLLWHIILFFFFLPFYGFLNEKLKESKAEMESYVL